MDIISKLRVGSAILRAKLFDENVPLIVSCVLTSRCNFMCKYCSVWKTKSDELSTDEILRIIKEMKTAKTAVLSLTGGEPLLRDDIGTIIQSARKHDIYVTMNSNGSLVKEHIDDILQLNRISISLDGNQAIHETHRGKGTYKKTIDGLFIAKEHGLNVDITTVITRHNVEHLDEVLSIAKDADVGVLFQPVDTYTFSGESVKEILAEKNLLREAIKKLVGDKTVLNSKAGLRHFIYPTGFDCNDCIAGRLFCRIEPDGSMYACSRSTNRKKPPNVRTGFLKGFKDLKDPVCKRCTCFGNVELNLLFQLKFNSILKNITKV